MTPPSAASVTSSEAPTSSPVKLARACAVRSPSRDGARVARAHAGAPADEAAEVLGLGQRALAARRGDLERVALAQVARAACVTRSHSASVTPSGWSMNTRRQRPPTTSASSTSTPARSAARRALDICLQRGHRLDSLRKKSGRRPLSVLLPAPARRHESCPSSIASGRAPGMQPSGAARRRGARGRGTAGSRRARAAASTPAPAACRPRDGVPAAASSGPRQNSA